MNITKTSIFGQVNTMDIPINEAVYDLYCAGQTGTVQETFPDLSDGDREFLISGMTPEEWEARMPPEDYGDEEEEDAEEDEEGPW